MLAVEITTSEWDEAGQAWSPVLSHVFYGRNMAEIEGLIKSHRITDRFFDASFRGTFKWRGSVLKLQNELRRVD